MIAPSGVHGAIAAQAPPSTPCWPMRASSESTTYTPRQAALTVSADAISPTSACPIDKNITMPSSENTSTIPYWATDSDRPSIRPPAMTRTSASARPAIPWAVMRLAMMAQPGAGVTRSRLSTPVSRSRPMMSAYPRMDVPISAKVVTSATSAPWPP
jgi:hypothetical protein